MALHVYGVVTAGTAVPDMTGVGESAGPLHLVEEGELAGVVSDLAEGAELTEDDAVRHLDVLCALAGTTAVLPLRFGTTAPDADAVRAEVLAPSASALRDRLAALRGLVELRVDLFFDEQQVLREVVRQQPGLREVAARSGDMSERLGAGEAVTQAVRQWTRERGDEATGRLAELVTRMEHLDTQEPLVERWALLVERDRVPEVDDAMAAVHGAVPEARVDYVGPLPAFDFPDETTSSGSGSRWGW